MATDDLLSVAALLVALLSALYARHARDAARSANAIAVHGQQRPLRLEVFRSLWSFADYCSTYYTLHRLKAVDGTRDLVSRIDSLRWELLQHGPLQMPEVDDISTQMVSSAWSMQRLIDLIARGHHETMDPSFKTADDHLHSLIDWFAEQRDTLKLTFAPYLAQTPTGNS